MNVYKNPTCFSRWSVRYTDENDMEQEVKVADLLASFKNQVIDFTVALKTDEELDVPSDEE